MNLQHYPVMSREVLEVLAGTAKELFVDCTVGGVLSMVKEWLVSVV